MWISQEDQQMAVESGPAPELRPGQRHFLKPLVGTWDVNDLFIH